LGESRRQEPTTRNMGRPSPEFSANTKWEKKTYNTKTTPNTKTMGTGAGKVVRTTRGKQE